MNTNFVLEGATGKDDIVKYLDFSKNPSAQNPAWNYVYSANNQPEAVDGYLYPGYYLPEDRAKRIQYLLDSKSNWDKAGVGKMIFDNTSAVAPSVVKDILLNLNPTLFSDNEKKAVALLKKWNGSNNLKDVAPTIYNKLVFNYLKNTFEDELGSENFKQFLNTHTVKQVIAKQISKEKSIWWDNVHTKNIKETRQQILSKSFKESILALENQLGTTVSNWTWNRVHTVEHEHPLGKIAAFRSFFNVGPYEVSGSNEVINNLFFDFTPSGHYQIKGGPSTRRIVDFSDI